MPISFDSERNRRKTIQFRKRNMNGEFVLTATPSFCVVYNAKTSNIAMNQEGEGATKLQSFPLLELPHPMAESARGYYLTYHFSFCQTACFSWFCFLCEYCKKCLKRTVCLSKTSALGQIRRPRAVN